jgi:CheY-like chemotaxis protein
MILNMDPAARSRVAIVDDNADVRLIMRTILEEQYEVAEFGGGGEALGALARALPDVVILDISMPGMDGIQVLKLIRSDASLKHLPVIALTANAVAGDRERFLAIGFDDYLAKPISSMDVLFSTIERWLPR